MHTYVNEATNTCACFYKYRRENFQKHSTRDRLTLNMLVSECMRSNDIYPNVLSTFDPFLFKQK